MQADDRSWLVRPTTTMEVYGGGGGDDGEREYDQQWGTQRGESLAEANLVHKGSMNRKSVTESGKVHLAFVTSVCGGRLQTI